MRDGAEEYFGLARERIHPDGVYPEHDRDIVTTGGSGFGFAGILTAIHRDFIPRDEGVERLRKMVGFLAGADRDHGMWPHWIDDKTGRTKPFGRKDDGAIRWKVRF